MLPSTRIINAIDNALICDEFRFAFPTTTKMPISSLPHHSYLKYSICSINQNQFERIQFKLTLYRPFCILSMSSSSSESSGSATLSPSSSWLGVAPISLFDLFVDSSANDLAQPQTICLPQTCRGSFCLCMFVFVFNEREKKNTDNEKTISVHSDVECLMIRMWFIARCD